MALACSRVNGAWCGAAQVDFFQGPHAIKNFDLFTAGGATSGAVSGLGQLYTWGQIKKVGESQVPSPWLSCPFATRALCGAFVAGYCTLVVMWPAHRR